MKDRITGWERGAPIDRASGAFTLVELLVVIAVIGVLSSLLLPVLAKAKARGQTILCLNNLKQLNLAWMMYAHDNRDGLALNLGAAEIKQMLASQANFNWASSVLNWELDPANTNYALNTKAALGVYLEGNARVFKCPSDYVLSSIQRKAGWTERTRSISMNAMIGDAGEFTRSGTNINNPSYRQFFRLSQIPLPAEVFVFVEEHPDSMNDGYFLNRAHDREWNDLPASYHSGAANLSFADGHAVTHHWTLSSTKPPAKPEAADLPLPLPEQERADFYWLLRYTSTYETHDDDDESPPGPQPK